MQSKVFAAAVLVLGSLSAAGQQPLRPPQLAPFGDSEWWVLTESIPTRIGVSSEIITVPKGFVTDLASIPRFFWAVYPKTGPYMSAAVLHDYLYWDQRCARAEADRIFDIEMKSFGVNDTSRKLIFAAVSDFGEGAWRSNTGARTSGEPRLMPPLLLNEFLSQPFDSSQTWSLWRDRVRLQMPEASLNAMDPNPQLTATCARAIAANGGQ